jgi:hypothetical protein
LQVRIFCAVFSKPLSQVELTANSKQLEPRKIYDAALQRKTALSCFYKKKQISAATSSRPAEPAGIKLRYGVVTAFTRAESRESLRETMFAFSTPLVTARCNSGCAARKAACAASLSPLATAASMFRMAVCTRDFRALLRAVRFAVCRMRLRADAMFAMDPSKTLEMKRAV